jgi:formylglycine-generating enzyme required for sulfatase activity
MQQTPNLGDMDSTAFNSIEEVASRFERAWSTADTVDLSQFLPAPGSPLRSVTLQELIKTDLEIRWKRRQPIALEYYAERYPELGGTTNLPPQLIFEEYRVRHLHGDRPALADYQQRFAAQFPEVQRLAQQQPLPPSTPVPSPSPFPNLSGSTPDQTHIQTARGGSTDGHSLPIAGGIKLLKRIGTGGFGEVWRAEAQGGVLVAVKIVLRPMDHSEAKREKDSLDLIKNLRHPFLLQTHSYHQQDDRLFIIMELADGSLRDRLKECQKAGQAAVPPQELVPTIAEAAEALDFLHENSVMHRDIKPENILLVRRHAKVADFGLARMQEGSKMGTATNSGTPLYMPPEIWKGKVTQHSDQYSLALTYAESRLGRRVFTGTDMMQVMIDHLERQPEFPELPPTEATVLLRALAKDPAQRFPSCLAFAEALRASFGGDASRAGGSLAGLTGTGQFSFSTATATGSLPGTLTPSGGVTPPLYLSGPVEAPRRPGLGVLVGSAVGTMLCVAVLAALVAFFWKWGDTEARSTQTGPVAIPGRLPEGYKPTDDATEITDAMGKKYPSRIVTRRGDQDVVFCLVPYRRSEEPPTFYMMENKVWNALFKVAAEDHDYKDPLEKRSSQFPWTIKRQWKLDGDGRLPVTKVTVEEASFFARWLGGTLPSSIQWDKAAGYYDEPRRGEGPFKGPLPVAPNEIGIKLEAPLPVGTGTRDESPYGIRDMAGNGLEWTRSFVGEPGLRVPLSKPVPGREQVTLRSVSFREDAPVTYAELDPENPRAILYKVGAKYDEVSDEIGFRVVLEP